MRITRRQDECSFVFRCRISRLPGLGGRLCYIILSCSEFMLHYIYSKLNADDLYFRF